MVNDKLGMIAFSKTKALEKRIKAIEDYIEQGKAPAQEVRDNK